MRKVLYCLCLLGLVSVGVGTGFAGIISDCPGTPLDNSSGTYAPLAFGTPGITCGNVVGNPATGSIVLTAPSDVSAVTLETFLGLSGDALGTDGSETGSAFKFTDFQGGSTGQDITFDYASGTGATDEYFYVLGNKLNFLNPTSGAMALETIQVPNDFSGVFGVGIIETGGGDPKLQVTNIAYGGSPSVPEPASMALLAFGLAGLGLFRKMRKRG